MRIIHTVPDVSIQASGPSYSVRRLCESLINREQLVILATLDLELGLLPSPPQYLQTFPLGTGPRRLGRSPSLKRWLQAKADNREVDIIHNHSLWMMPNIYPGWVAKKFDLPLVVSPRGTLSSYAFGSGSVVKRGFWPALQKPVLETAACFHATAKSEYNDIRKMGFKQPVMVIPNGVDIPECGHRLESQRHKLLYLGRIHPEKGIEELLRAWQTVSNRFRDWTLEIVGPDIGGYLAVVQQLASKLSLTRVQFSEPVFGDEKFNKFAEASLYVLPSPSENFGMTVAESLATGTPVIATKGSPWQGLEFHDAGWWIDVGVDPLVAGLEIALGQSDQALEEKGARGKKWVEQEFSWPQVANKTLDAYRWIAEGGPKPTCVLEY